MKAKRRGAARGSGKVRKLLERALAAERAGDVAAAAAQYRRLLDTTPKHPEANYRLGMLHLRGGDPASALRCLEVAAAAHPGDADLLNTLGQLHLRLAQQGKASPAAAEQSLRAALAAQPAHPAARANLAELLHGQGRHAEAVVHFEGALAARPDWLAGKLRLALSLVAIGELDRARQRLAQTLDEHPGDLDALADVGTAYRLLGDAGTARSLFERAHAQAPEDPQILDSLGLSLVDAGDMQRAEQSFEAALARAPRSAVTWYNRVRVRRFTAADADATERLAALAADPRLPAHDGALACFALGKVRGDQGDVDGAFAAYARANALQRSLVPHDTTAEAAWFDAIRHRFDAATFQRLAGSGVASEVPVLIVGMPRSGTTLIEQILSSHPAVHGAGERRELPATARRLAGELGTAYPHCVATVDPEQLAALGGSYLERLRVLAPAAARITDKLPSNFQHLGLAALLFRGLRIVHCRRDPMDTCLSNFVQYFAEGHSYAYDLDSTARMFGHYHRLMAHWHAVLPVPILDVDYEALVEDLEPQVRRLLAHLGLDFDPRCVRFHENQRRVDTASNWQVRQPIYREAARRWKRFERHLGPLRAALNRELPELVID